MPVLPLLLLLLGFAAPAGAAGHPALTLQLDGTRLLAIDARTGHERWRFENDATLFEPVLAEGRVYVTGRSGRLHALDARDGTPIWTLATRDEWIYPPLPVGGRLIVVGRHSGLRALAAADGAEIWHTALRQEPTYKPTVLDNRRALVALFNGDLLAVDSESGQQVWRTRLATPALNISADTNRIVFGGYDSRLRAVSAADGHRLWSQPIPGKVVFSPVFNGDTAIVATDERTVVVADLHTGRLLDQVPIPANCAVDRDSIRQLIHRRNKAEPCPVSIAAHTRNQ